MYYFYPCPKCGRSITEWENDQAAEWDEQDKLLQATKEHFLKWHYPQDLIWTDDEIKYKVKESVQQSQEAPLE